MLGITRKEIGDIDKEVPYFTITEKLTEKRDIRFK